MNATDLTPAQLALLDALRRSPSPIALEGERRYSLAGERVHYATVEALERRGILSRHGDALVLVDQAPAESRPEDARNTHPDSATPTPPASARSAARPVDIMVVRPNDSAVALSHDTTTAPAHDFAVLLEADEAKVAAARHADLRAPETAGCTDPATRARDAIRERRPRPAARDESVLGWLWRRLETMAPW